MINDLRSYNSSIGKLIPLTFGMNPSNVGVAELFYLLESNKLNDVEEIKKIFHDHFLSTKDSWLVNGLFDYYLSTNSLRAVEVLTGVREPHDKHLLDRLAEALAKSGNQGQKVQVLTLLGYVARRQPTWLYKIANHVLFKELLKLLKVEGDMLLLVSALLLLVTLLPMLPAALGPYLYDIFEVFGRLASYHHHQSSFLSSSTSLTSASCPINIDKDRLYLLHLQVGLYSLFHRLYAMYPCNFVSYLRQQYTQRDQLETFAHTVRPMLDSVRMHPLLVTASKDAETSAARWKKMEHHDIVAECGRFALDRCREETLVRVPSNLRFTPILDPAHSYVPVGSSGGITAEVNTGDEDNFWSPSMIMPPHTPPPLQVPSHEPRSTPSTPNNIRSGTSPPEAAVEATPETTPVKDLRQLATRQVPVGSTAIRALGGFGNGTLGTNSRPPTPTPTSQSATIFTNSGIGSGDCGTNSHTIFSQKINKLVAERQAVLQHSQMSSTSADLDRRISEIDLNQNEKNDSSQEDQEVLEIVNSSYAGRGPSYSVGRRESCNKENISAHLTNLSKKFQRLRFYSQCQSLVPIQITHLRRKIHRAKSCPEIKTAFTGDKEERLTDTKTTEEAGTQTGSLVPYEYLLTGILSWQHQGDEQQASRQNSDSRLSPSSMLDRYVEACTRTSNFPDSNKLKAETAKLRQRKRGSEDDAGDDPADDNGLDTNYANQQLQLMQMQLQFERQRREVYAERNRRLLGKLRDSRALEEHNSALTDRLRLTEKEVEGLKSELERSKREARLAEGRFAEALLHWQSKCVEEEQHNQTLRDRCESLELEVKNERRKVAISDKQTRSAEAALFDAAHQLKCALWAADRGEELKRILDIVQKRFLLLGEAQVKLQEHTGGLTPMVKQETAQMQKSYTEELSNLRRQVDSRASLIEALRTRLVELENRETRKETHLLEQQRLLLEAKERHEAELRAVESKYKAQVEINLLLEGRILELHGTLEAATCSTNAAVVNLASSASPKERSPPLSASLASSSEGSLAFIHSGSGIMMNDCCDSVGEIPNLQAIVEPAPSLVTTPCRTSQRQTPKQD